MELHDELNAVSYQNPDKDLHATELSDLVYRLSNQLTKKQRTVFVLRDLEQLEVNEVCEILDMSAGNVKSNLYYARLYMKEALTKYYTI